MKFNKVVFASLTFFIFYSPYLFAQKAKSHVLTTDEAKMVKKDGAGMFAAGDFKGALKAFKDLYVTDPKNFDYNFKIGFSYLMVNDDKAQAVKYLEVANKSKDAKKEWIYYLATAYMHAHRFDDAIAAFNRYKTDGANKPIKDFIDADRAIAMCNNARELVSKPVNVTFVNMGKMINTPFEEYTPMISADGSTLVFSSRRKGNMGGYIEELAMYTADIYWSYWRDTMWTKAKGGGAGLNTEWDEELVGLSPGGDMALMVMDNFEGFGDIATSILKGKTWQKYLVMPANVNSKQFETGATMSIDGTKLVFCRDSKDGKTKTDLYIVTRKHNGSWSDAVMLPNDINTPYEDEAPWFAADGKTLYFSSKGHNSMGGLDVFKTVYNETSNSWSKPENIGYPLNTTDDNSFYSMTGNGRIAYIAQWRQGSLGDKDIWQVKFNDENTHPFLSTLAGNITTAAGPKPDVDRITLTDTKTGNVVTTYAPQSPNPEYVLCAPAGSYKITIYGNNFNNVETDVVLDGTDMAKNIEVVVGK